MPAKRQLRKRKSDATPAVVDGKKPKDDTNEEEIKTKRMLFNDTVPRKYWILKSEPNSRMVKNVDVSFSIYDLMAEDEQTAEWNGVRSREARNNLKAMQIGDLAFFYHSSCREPGIAGIIEIVKTAYPDQCQFNRDSPYYDLKSKQDDPLWFSVDVKLVRKFDNFIALAELKKHWDHLQGMVLLSRQRLSVQPIAKQYFDYILGLDLTSATVDNPASD